MKIDEIQVGDRCWFPSFVSLQIDGTNATVKDVRATSTSYPGQITITTDDGAVWKVTPGVNVFWSRPKDEHMPRVPRRITKTMWACVYKNFKEDGGISMGKLFSSKDDAYCWRSMSAPTIALSMPPWVGNRKFHKSHKSNLLRKDKAYYGKHFKNVPDNLPYEWPIP